MSIFNKSSCLPIPPKYHNSSAVVEKCDRVGSSEENYRIPLKLNVEYDFLAQTTTLLFAHPENEDFHLKSMEVCYEFEDYKLPRKDIDCIIKSRIYQFSMKTIKRHLFYETFYCTTIFAEDNKDDMYDIKFSFQVPNFEKKSGIILDSMGSYFPSTEIINIFNHDLKVHPELNDKEQLLLQDLENNNLQRLDALKYAINIEDMTQQKALSECTALDVTLDRMEERRSVFYFNIKNSSLPPNIDQSSLCLIDMEKFVKDKFMINKESECVFGFIVECIKKEGSDESTIRFTQQYEVGSLHNNKIYTSVKYAIRFIPNRITHRASLNAVNKVNNYNLQKFFDEFKDEPCSTNIKRHRLGCLDINDFKWCNTNINSNDQQKVAIKNIVNCSAYPFPYCIFGPPGTGKTSCLVECIIQILHFKPNSKILVTAQSNSACDEVGERLLQYTDAFKIFRLYSPSLLKTKDEINKKLLPLSNLRNLKDEIFPTTEELKTFPITICTITSSSKLDRAKIHKHYDYIFIDECAATTEPEVLIPIVGLGCDLNAVDANIVLIGDHKQLPPVIQSSFASNLKLDVSLMERMMQTERFLPKPDDGFRYDNRYVTQLLDNYRSHPAILHFSNVEFYEAKLCARNRSSDVFVGTKFNQLPNKDFPIIFHCNTTPSQIMYNSTSSYNEGELYIVKRYVDNLLSFGIGSRKILESDIGVVTPYKAQGLKFKELLPTGVEVGTSEYYQGREKLIMIFSTVRSKTSLGFVKDKRRMNVCLTRAKALLIVVGNPYTLKQNQVWKRFVYFCINNNACVGLKFSLKPYINRSLIYKRVITGFENDEKLMEKKQLVAIKDNDDKNSKNDNIFASLDQKLMEINDNMQVLIEMLDEKMILEGGNDNCKKGSNCDKDEESEEEKFITAESSYDESTYCDCE